MLLFSLHNCLDIVVQAIKTHALGLWRVCSIAIGSHPLGLRAD